MDCERQTAPRTRRLTRLIWRRVWTLQCLVLLVALGLTMPLLSGFLAFSFRGTDPAEIVDLDLPLALLRPAGWLLLAIVALIWLSLALFGHAAQLVIAREAMHGREVTVPAALDHVVRRARGLSALIMRFAVQSLAIAAPFLLLIPGVLHLQIRQSGPGRSLSEIPPELVFALAFAALLLAGMLLVLTRHLSVWLHALPRFLFHGDRPAEARRHSRKPASGHGARLFFQLLVRLSLPPLGLLAIGLACVPPLLRGADLLDHRIGLTSLLCFVALAVCAVAGLLIHLISASFFTAFHARLAAAGEDGSVSVPVRSSTSARIPWAVATGSAVVFVATTFQHLAWLDSLRPESPPQIIAHRGASAKAPENTIAAIEAAIEAGADRIEIDVQHHASGGLFLFHDRDLRRIAGNPARFRDVPAEMIGDLDAGAWFSPDFRGERVPTLSSALETCRGRCELMIELKSFGPRAEMAEAVVAAVERAGMADSVDLMSFDRELIARLRDMRPDWRIGLVTSAHPLDFDFPDFLAVGRGVLSRSLTRRAANQGVEIHAWTVNRPMDISSAVSRGAAGVITDRPRTARRVLHERARLNPAERLSLDLLSRLAMIRDFFGS